MNWTSLKVFISVLAISGELKYGEGRRDRMGEGLNVQIEAPSSVRVGETVVLKCLYDLGGDSLYTMKWYRGPDEFYRFTPKESPPVKTFPSPGLSIDLANSNATHLTLQRADLSLSGRYDCEVTTDFPNVIANVKQVYLRVIAYPEKRPEIVIIPNKRRYSVGDILEANCTSYRSKPAANLTWLINGKRIGKKIQVNSRYHQHDPQEYRFRDLQNTETSRFTIRIAITSEHFVGGQLKLSCLAEIADHYHQTSEVIISEEDRPKISSVVDNSSSTGSGSNSRFTNSGSSSGTRTATNFFQNTPKHFLLHFLLLLALLSRNIPSFILNLHCKISAPTEIRNGSPATPFPTILC
ncbi:uncharacterized protein LOC110851365 isoform X1 [Folsomia candida]|uniref:uncharacterized protein LOC110851365 isoform X1 n=1 Tax=Folsomia candida TaxID=158441 RepID=UPI00160510D8|nr:uncharacterized protein LOC110851365 isoform X1 [Folsomia candida]XP_035708916.1 uncharacterized protein LOC110851365 isoform X1 [Folsomia candida]